MLLETAGVEMNKRNMNEENMTGGEEVVKSTGTMSKQRHCEDGHVAWSGCIMLSL